MFDRYSLHLICEEAFLRVMLRLVIACESPDKRDRGRRNKKVGILRRPVYVPMYRKETLKIEQYGEAHQYHKLGDLFLVFSFDERDLRGT